MDVSNLARIIKTNIIRVLTEQGISRNELSRRTGITQGSMVTLLNGEREIQTDTLQRISEALGVSVASIVLEGNAASSSKRERQKQPAA